MHREEPLVVTEGEDELTPGYPRGHDEIVFVKRLTLNRNPDQRGY